MNEQEMNQIALELSNELEKLISKFQEKLNPIQVLRKRIKLLKRAEVLL